MKRTKVKGNRENILFPALLLLCQDPKLEAGNAAPAVEAPVQAATVQRLEDIILTKARDLRRSAVL